jgi:D-methionine transport system permease protein
LAAIVPLTIAAIPFFARIAEVSLREVDQGLIEAAQAMGCNRKQILWHVLLPEALPGIVAGFTVTIVTMISSSAIAVRLVQVVSVILPIVMAINVLICKSCWR